MKVEVIRIGDQVTLQASPPIQQFRFGNRSAETTLNMRDGETIVLGGLIQEEDRRTRVTMPWIGDLPVIGNWLSSFKTERVTTEVILTITPRIMQSPLAPGSTNQAFWSGTETSYATSPLFSSAPKKTLAHLSGSQAERGALSSSAVRSKNDPVSASSLMKAAVAGPVLSIQPGDAAIQIGKEVKLTIVDERLRASADGLFHLEYDPLLLRFRRLLDAELVEASGGEAGKLSFRLSRPDSRAPRTVIVIFGAAAVGVSPVRVELVEADRESAAQTTEIGTGVVRVR
jgi:general secretion pathway protein D